MELGLGSFFVFPRWEDDGKKGEGLLPVLRGIEKYSTGKFEVRRGEHSASLAAQEGGRWV